MSENKQITFEHKNNLFTKIKSNKKLLEYIIRVLIQLKYLIKFEKLYLTFKLVMRSIYYNQWCAVYFNINITEKRNSGYH